MTETLILGIPSFGEITFNTNDCDCTDDGYLYYAAGSIDIVPGWFDEYMKPEDDFIRGNVEISIDENTHDLESMDIEFNSDNGLIAYHIVPEDIDSAPIKLDYYIAAMDNSDNYDYRNEV